MEEGMERERERERDKRRETGFQHREAGEYEKWDEREKRERSGRGPVLTR